MNAISDLILQENNTTLKVFCLSTEKHRYKAENLENEYIAQTRIEASEINTKTNVFKFVSNVFNAYPYTISRFYDKNANKKLLQILKKENFDFIILESIFVGPYLKILKKYSDAKIVLRAHNVETELLQKRIEQSNIIEKTSFIGMQLKMKYYESKVGNLVDGILSIGKREASFFRKYSPNTLKTILPNPVKLKNTNFSLSQSKIKLFHIGAMDWQPNMDGIDHFIKKVWNDKLADNFEFHIAGKGLDKKKYAHINGIHNHGFVASAFNFMNSCDIMIVPLKTASGVRIKILEAMSIGKPVITTKNGLLGIEAKNGLEVLRAVTIDDITRILNRIADKHVNLVTVSKNAKEFVSTNYSYPSIQNQLFNFLTQIA